MNRIATDAGRMASMRPRSDERGWDGEAGAIPWRGTSTADQPLARDVLSDHWRLEYNHRRPHYSSLGYVAPAAFAASLAAPAVGAAPLPPEQQAKEQKQVILS